MSTSAPSLVLDPATLSTIGTAFDDAWASIADTFDVRGREAARLELATIVLELAQGGHREPVHLTRQAVSAMRSSRGV